MPYNHRLPEPIFTKMLTASISPPFSPSAYPTWRAAKESSPNTLARHSHHLVAEEQTSTKVGPITIVDVTRQNDEVDLLLDRKIHQGNQSMAGDAAKALHGRAVVAVEPAQGAVNMQVCGMMNFMGTSESNLDSYQALS